MSKIKIPLRDLVVLFARSAADQMLAEPVRKFAARLMVLTAHTERIGAAVSDLAKRVASESEERKKLAANVDKQISEIASIIASVMQGPAAVKPSAPPSATAAAAPAAEPTEADDEDTEDLERQIQEEAAREIAAINAAERAEAPAVTPLRAPKAGGAP